MAYTTIDDPSAHFQTVLWTGNATARNITNDGNSDLQPDFIWMKCRDSNTAHIWQLSNLGVTKYFRSNLTSAIGTASSLITSFNTDGFGITNNSSNNVDTEKNVAWQWKANGNSTSSNTDGDITSTIQTNSTAGFTIGTYTGNGSNNQTIGHGLGARPNWIIVKRKDTAAAWLVWHEDNSKYYQPGANLGPGYSKCNLHTLLIGPNSCGYQNDDFLLGLFMLGPRTLYRDHKHDAPELYLNLTDQSGWRFKSGEWQDYPAGSFIWNAPGERHAARVYEQPFISVFAWLENVNSPCQVIHFDDWEKIEKALLSIE